LVQRPANVWIEPISDARALPSDSDPSERAMLKQSIRLAFVAALQKLAPKQRAALLLMDVLGFSAAEAAETLDTSVASVNSALQRARATLSDRNYSESPDLSAPQMEMLNRYVTAFEQYDIDALTSLLRQDATLSMPPYALWFEGPCCCRPGRRTLFCAQRCFLPSRTAVCTGEGEHMTTAQLIGTHRLTTMMSAETTEYSQKHIRAGGGLTGLSGAFSIFDDGMKLLKPPVVVQATVQLGYPESTIVGIGVVLLACTLLYLIPRTSILGAVLLTGYLGGAVVSNLRAEQPVFNIVFPVVFACIAWGGLWLRDARLEHLLPLKDKA
jgi:DoxX-like family/Sigma-70, region 4